MGVREELARLTMDLVAIPSVTEDPGGRTAVIDYIEHFCAAIPGVTATRFESHGIPSLVASLGQARRTALILNAHVDVVPGLPEQFRPREEDGRIYGRGAQDMKAAAAAMLLVLRTLAQAGEQPSVQWQFVTDEEIGGQYGTGHLVAEGYTGDFFLAGEPTDLEIVNRAKGILWVVVHQPGDPAHGSRPWDGVNPIAPLATGLGRLLARYPIPDAPVWRTTVTPASIHGGDAQNRVPVDCMLKLDVRRIPDEDPDAIIAYLRECFPGATVEVAHNGAALHTVESSPHVQRLHDIIAATGDTRPAFRSEHFGSDARFFSEAGIPAVCFGPIGSGLHSHVEWVDIASVERFYHIIHALARSY